MLGCIPYAILRGSSSCSSFYRRVSLLSRLIPRVYPPDTLLVMSLRRLEPAVRAWFDNSYYVAAGNEPWSEHTRRPYPRRSVVYLYTLVAPGLEVRLCGLRQVRRD